jgi:hypothetical protein
MLGFVAVGWGTIGSEFAEFVGSVGMLNAGSFSILGNLGKKKSEPRSAFSIRFEFEISLLRRLLRLLFDDLTPQ